MKRLITKTLVFFNYVAAFSLILSYLATHISPDFFWPPAFFGLAFPFLAGVNLLFVIFWGIKLKKYFLISLISLLLGFNHIANTLPNPFLKNELPERSTHKTLRILSYNVRAFNIYDWLNDPNTDKGIFNFIRSEHPDIICMQEFFTNPYSRYPAQRFQRLFEETPYSHIEYSEKNVNNRGFGNATFSKYPITHKGVLRFDNSSNIAIYTDIKINEDTFRIINIHLQSIKLKANNYAFLDSIKMKYDEKQIRELHDVSGKLKSAFIKRAGQVAHIKHLIKQSPHKVIVCGDFNDPPVSYAYRKIRGNLKDAWVESGKKSWGYTYLGKPPFRIDYILYDKSLESLSFEKVKTRLSDHYPIVSVLNID